VPVRHRVEHDPVLSAAAELFEQHGYERVAVEAIAERSGFARSTVFARYTTKEALLVGIVRSFFTSFPAFCAAHAARDPRPVCAIGERVPASDSPPGPAGGDGGEAEPTLRILAALRRFCTEAGALARVALAARDLPWVRASLARTGFSPSREFGRLLGPAGADPLFVALTMELLKHACARASPGAERIDEATLSRLLALLHVWAPALGRDARVSG
jgi:AcrR family transcriptional regulator